MAVFELKGIDFAAASEPDYSRELQCELVNEYIKINPDDIKVHLERQDNLEVLEVKIELPEPR